MKNFQINDDDLQKVMNFNKRCVDCKKCFKECPMMNSFGDSPKKIMSNIEYEKQVNIKLPYACMLCNKCTEVCPKGLNLKDIFYGLRKNIFFNNKKGLSSMGYKTVKYHQTASFSSIFSTKVKKKSIKRIFIPGCSLSSYDNKIVQGTYNYLKSILDDIELLVMCCGKPTLDIGDSLNFNEYYSKINNIIKEKKVEEVIVACSNCYNTIKKNSPNVKVRIIWDVISDNGLPDTMKDLYKDVDIEFALHDPCPIKQEHGIHNNVREILQYIGVKYIEFEKNRENTECCGYGAMVGVFNKEIALKQMRKRADSANSKYIISYCESCVEAMLNVNKKSLHLLDFLFNESVLKKQRFSQETKSVLKKWNQRYKTVKIKNKLGEF